jgi:SagB-type dehydrogenase family enzyme
VLRSGGSDALARWYHHLGQLARRGVLVFSVCAGGERLATLVPLAPAFALPVARANADRACVLSRFAYLRRAGAEMVLESPLTAAHVVLHDGRAAALVHALARPGTAAEVVTRVSGLPAEVGTQLLALLRGAGMLSEVDDRGTAAEDVNAALISWEFPDLLFHVRSREGRCDSPLGGVYPLAGVVNPPPALKPVTASEQVELYRPDLERLQREDPPLAQVQERRRSVREYGEQPMSARQLGEFLYRVARVRDRREVEVDTPQGGVRLEITSRPYPSGGALYELELYPVVRRCTNLSPGLYHYDPLHHRLGRVCEPTAEVEQLWSDAARATGVEPESIQVLLILTARFQRLAWKYAGLAYALILKHVGVVYQTMYLAATAMGLAPCAVGGGNADLFVRALGSDYYAETSVGEFLLGSRG